MIARILTAAVIFATGSKAVLPSVNLQCLPCIDRSLYRVKAIVHGTTNDAFWQRVRAAAIQAGQDMRIDLEMDLFDNFDTTLMAKMILETVSNNTNSTTTSDSLPDALLVSIPSKDVEDAVRQAIQTGMPVFGINSGYNVAKEAGLLGYVAMDEYQAGIEAAHQFLANNRNISRALYVNHQEGNFALEQRYNGFLDGMVETDVSTATEKINSTAIAVNQVYVDLGNIENIRAVLNKELKGCPYDAVLLSGATPTPHAIEAFKLNGCPFFSVSPNGVQLGTFDIGSETYDYISTKQLEFTIDQQEYLQGALGVVMASLYATTGKRLAISSEQDFGVYLSGPAVVNFDDIPYDMFQTCPLDSFPVCPNTKAADGITESLCPCADRTKITIGGVVHGTTYDTFWDPIFASAQQAADDMNIELKLDRYGDIPRDDVMYSKMANKVLSLCQEGIDGLFITIPSELMIPAIKRCLDLNVPIISINTGSEISRELGLVHHIAQSERTAGYESGKRMIEAGMEVAYCLNHFPSNPVLAERCAGFEDAIKESNENITYSQVIVDVAYNIDIYKQEVEEILQDYNGDWEGIGLLLGGIDQLDGALELKNIHEKVLIGSFDVSEDLFAAIEDQKILFGVDQEAYLQGYMPVVLLTLISQTKQRLQNRMIESGPKLVTTVPSTERIECEATFFEVCPEEIEYDYNHLDSVRPLGLLFFAIVASSSLYFAAWVLCNQDHRVVSSSQPEFLLMICVGTLTMGAAIIPLGIDDGIASYQASERGCIAVPWLLCLGFTITFSALFSKLRRINKLIKYAKQFRRAQVSVLEVMKLFGVLLVMNAGLLTAFTISDPYTWIRESSCGMSETTSYGYCSYNGKLPWALLWTTTAVNFAALIIANFEAFKARKISVEYAESKYVATILLTVVQVCVIAGPILALLNNENPPAKYILTAACIFIVCVTTLGLIFVPKITFLKRSKRGKNKAQKTSKRASSILVTTGTSASDSADATNIHNALSRIVVTSDQTPNKLLFKMLDMHRELTYMNASIMKRNELSPEEWERLSSMTESFHTMLLNDVAFDFGGSDDDASTTHDESKHDKSDYIIRRHKKRKTENMC